MKRKKDKKDTVKVVQLLSGQVIIWPSGLRTLFVRDEENDEWFMSRMPPTAADHRATAAVLRLQRPQPIKKDGKR